MLKYILLCIVAFSGYYAWTTFPIEYGPGVLASEKPKVERVSWEKPFPHKGLTIAPVRRVSGEVRILKHKRYFFDSRSSYSPVDLLVGWNEMSDERNLDHLHFSMDNRYFEMNYTRPPLEFKKMYSEMNLWHMVPSNEEIDAKIKKLRTGNVITLEGFYVDVQSSSGFNWKSEILQPTNSKLQNLVFWVESIQVR